VNVSDERITYKGQDITLDVDMKIEQVVEIIAATEKTSFDDAYWRFTGAAAHAALRKPSTLMWAESAEYIADRYFDSLSESTEARAG
jgi:hypothetical protein